MLELRVNLFLTSACLGYSALVTRFSFICDLGTVKLLARGGGDSGLKCCPKAIGIQMKAEQARETVETFDRSTVCECGPYFEFQKTVSNGGILYDIRAHKGNSQNY